MSHTIFAEQPLLAIDTSTQWLSLALRHNGHTNLFHQETGNRQSELILPQIAALGAAHYKVSKEETAEGTVSRMQRLTPEERIQEIAQMLSGSNVTAEAVSNAKALLKNV